MVDCVLWYENLNVELFELFSELGVLCVGVCLVNVKGNYCKDCWYYWEIYSQQQCQYIEWVFVFEIVLLGYQFQMNYLYFGLVYIV